MPLGWDRHEFGDIHKSNTSHVLLQDSTNPETEFSSSIFIWLSFIEFSKFLRQQVSVVFLKLHRKGHNLEGQKNMERPRGSGAKY
jgi:hypothetical protein